MLELWRQMLIWTAASGLYRPLWGSQEKSSPPGGVMIVLGLILLVVGWLAGISILTTIGVVLLVIGAILAVLGAVGKPVGGRAHYF